MKRLVTILIFILTFSPVAAYAYDVSMAMSRPSYNDLLPAEKQYIWNFFQALTGDKKPFEIKWAFRNEITQVEWCVINFGNNAFQLGGMSDAKVLEFRNWAESKKLYIRKGEALQWLKDTKIEGKPMPT